MTRITIAPIVEGQGEDGAVRDLLWRVWTELVGGEHATVLKPIRRSRGRFLKFEEGDLEHAVQLAVLKLQEHGGGTILILVDAEDDCRKIGPLGPKLLARAQGARSDVDIMCVIANTMYETWFVAAAESLTEYFNIAHEEAIPADPEADRVGKSWVKSHMKNGKYRETADQPRLTAKMDLALCRTRSKSFQKLCRELEKRFRGN